jgi:NADPH:quinone reductase-like Zn-dependent oxidoreductase
MKAVRIHSFGGPEVLQLEDVPQPEPRDDEVLVHVRAASVNPVDYKMRSGGYAKPERLPMELGRDISGTVARCGTQVQRLKSGDDVYAMLPWDRYGYAEYVAVKANDSARKPARIDHQHAAAVPLAALTAWQGLFDHGELKSGQRVLIHGAAGGVGHFAVQFAKQAGAEVIATATRAHEAFLRELGADQVIDHHEERFEDRVRDVDVVFDLVGGETQDRSWTVLKSGGVLVSTLGQPPEDKARAHNVRAKGYMAHPSAEQLSQIATLIDEGKVRPYVESTFELRDVAKAQQHLEKDHVRGKIVLVVSK